MLGALIACLALGAASLAGLAAAKPGKQAAPFKAAWIYVGPHNDGGWSQAHESAASGRAEGAGWRREDDV